MNHQDKGAPFHLAGWVLFLLCAFLFLYVAVRDRDVILALASLVFLAGCIAFLIPLLKRDKKTPIGNGSPDPDYK
jgi:hypothetical protein